MILSLVSLLKKFNLLSMIERIRYYRGADTLNLRIDDKIQARGYEFKVHPDEVLVLVCEPDCGKITLNEYDWFMVSNVGYVKENIQ